MTELVLVIVLIVSLTQLVKYIKNNRPTVQVKAIIFN